ncbi:MAG TPA: DHA2 family efflux MFS transporter permease subunit [Solirubrobacteraceae bacterium]
MQRKWRVTSVVVAGVFMASLDLFIVNIAFPDIAKDFDGTSISSLSWILNAYAIVFAALLVPAGRWADAYGRKRVFLAGLAIFIAASAACAAAPSVELLVAARVVQAAGGALLLPTSLGLMLPEFQPHERPVAIGIWAATGGVAAAAGPPLGGLLVEADWRWVFLVNIPVGAAALFAAWRTLTEVRDPAARRPDVLGALLLVGAVAALIVAIVQGQDWGWDSARVIGAVLFSVLLFGGVVQRSLTHHSPVVDPAMVRVRGFTLAVVGSIAFFVGFATMLLAGVLLLTNAWHESVLTAGLMLAPGPTMAAAFSIPSARLATKVGYRVTGMLGSAIFALAGVWWLTQLGNDPAYASEFLPGFVVGGIGVGLMLPTLTGAGAASLPPHRFSTGVAVITMGRQIGSALGVAVLVAILNDQTAQATDFTGAWWLMIGAAAVTGLTLSALGRPQQAPARAAVPAEVAA